MESAAEWRWATAQKINGLSAHNLYPGAYFI